MKLSSRGIVIAVMIAAHVSNWHSCLHGVKMARTVRVCSTAWLQPEGTEEPETNPSVHWQEEQPDATESKVTADDDPHVDYEGSEPRMTQMLKNRRKTLIKIMQK